MDIKTLKNFVTVAEKGSILKAANALHISQPPLSKQMQLLEKELGVTLFIRTPRGIRLTDKGELLYKKALSLISYSDSILSELQQPSVDTIHIGLVTSATQYGLSLISEYSQDHNTDFSIVERDSFEHIKMLEKGLLDIALVRSPFEISEGIQSFKLCDDCLTAIGSSGFFNTASNTVDFSDFEDVPLIIPRRWYNHIAACWPDQDTKLHFRYICENNHTAVSLAKNSMGVAIVPGTVSLSSGTDGELSVRPFRDENLQTGLYLLCGKKYHSSPAVSDFISFILKKE